MQYIVVKCLQLILIVSSAIDTVDYTIFLSVIQLTDSLCVMRLQAVFSYLSDWSQSINYVGKQTAVFSAECSVPQGSVLGLIE